MHRVGLVVLLASCGARSTPPSPQITEAPACHPPGSIGADPVLHRVAGAVLASAEPTELWRVPCADPAGAVRLAQRDGASFRAAVLAPTGTTLYFTDAGGVGALDVATGDITEVYRTPQVDIETWISCPQVRAKASPVDITLPTDEVIAISDDGAALWLRRGATCGEGGYGSFTVVLESFQIPGAAREHVAHAIRVIGGGGDHLWMADGTGVWLSRDGAEHWHELVVAPGPDQDDLGAEVIDLIADRAAPARALVLTEALEEMGGGWYFAGGHALITDDAGHSWRALPLPASVPGCDFTGGDGPLIASIDAVDGSLDRLRLSAWCDGGDGHQVRVGLSSDDGGQRWSTIPAPPAATRPRQLTLGADWFEATGDGLWRTRGGERRDVSPPFGPPYPADGDY